MLCHKVYAIRLIIYDIYSQDKAKVNRENAQGAGIDIVTRQGLGDLNPLVESRNETLTP